MHFNKLRGQFAFIFQKVTKWYGFINWFVVFMLLIDMLIMSDTSIAFKSHAVSYSTNSAYSLNSYHIVIWCQFKDWLCFSSCSDILFTKNAALRVCDKMLLRALWHSGTWLG